MIMLSKLKEHFEVRAIEWGMSGWAVTWGLQALINPEVFTSPETGPLNIHMLHTLDWLMSVELASILLPVLAILVGVLRAVALYVNGAWHQTPLVRMVTSALSAFVVSNIVFSLMQGPATLGVITYSWLFAADCFSGFRAAKDYRISKGA